jgi:hypothetical protein
VCGHKMSTVVSNLVVLNDNQASNQGIDCNVIDGEMCDRSLTFLLRGVCGLENEDTLSKGEKTRGVEEGMCGEEYKVVEEDIGPDGRYEQNDSCLRYYCCSYHKVSDG